MALKRKKDQKGEAKRDEERKREEEKKKRILQEIDDLMAQDNSSGYTNARYVLTNVPPAQEAATPLDEDGGPIEMPGEGKGFSSGSAATDNAQAGNPAGEGDVLHESDFTHESLMLLDFYIQEMKKEGIPKGLIRRKLERTGWPGWVVDKLL